MCFLFALAVFLILESFFFPLWLNVRNWLLFIIDHPKENILLADRIHTLVLLGGILASTLAAIIAYFIFSVFTRSLFATRKVLALQEWFQELYAEAPVPYLLITSDHKMLQPNKAALRLFGCNEQVFSLVGLKNMIAPEDHELLEHLMNRFKRGLAVNSETIRIVSRDKMIRWTLFSIFTKERQSFTSIRQGLAAFVDITEQKRLENELRMQITETQKFAQAVDSSSDGVAITSPDGAIVYVNTAWEHLFGYTHEEVRDQNIRMVESDSTPASIGTSMQKSIETRTPFKSEEVIHRRKDGREFHTEIEIFPIIDTEKDVVQFYVYIERDISKRKEIDRAKSEFVSLSSHQLRTPMLTLQWYAEMLLSGDAGALLEKQKEYVQKMHRGSQNILSLVNLFLDISKIEMGVLPVKAELVDPIALVDGVLEELAPNIEKKHCVLKKFLIPRPAKSTQTRICCAWYCKIFSQMR